MSQKLANNFQIDIGQRAPDDWAFRAIVGGFRTEQEAKAAAAALAEMLAETGWAERVQ